MRHSMFRILLVACSVFLAAAASRPTSPTRRRRTGVRPRSHVAPHDGTLIALGDHVAHVELLLDAEDGTVRLYVLGATRKGRPDRRPGRSPSTCRASVTHAVTAEALVLHAVPSLLTGEQVGDTSEFAAAHPALVGAPGFAGRLRAITVRGVTFTDVAVSGATAAEDHDDAHDHAHPEHGHEH